MPSRLCPACRSIIREGSQCNCRASRGRNTGRLNASQRGYTWAWQKASRQFREENPWCAECARQGIVTRCQVVDHIVPHKGNEQLFWDKTNWQALCKPCHDAKTATEDGGFGNEVRR